MQLRLDTTNKIVILEKNQSFKLDDLIEHIKILHLEDWNISTEFDPVYVYPYFPTQPQYTQPYITTNSYVYNKKNPAQ